MYCAGLVQIFLIYHSRLPKEKANMGDHVGLGSIWLPR